MLIVWISLLVALVTVRYILPFAGIFAGIVEARRSGSKGWYFLSIVSLVLFIWSVSSLIWNITNPYL